MPRVRTTVDGIRYDDDVAPRTLLVTHLRETLGKVGTVVGCDTSNCGACTVLMSDPAEPGRQVGVKSCAVLAVQADGCEITTIEGLSRPGAELHPVQRAFHERHALQCGFCTPGMIMASVDLLGDNPDPTDADIRQGLAGNLCRCTGYQNIVRAVRDAAAAMRAPGATPDATPDAASTTADPADPAGTTADPAGTTGTTADATDTVSRADRADDTAGDAVPTEAVPQPVP